MPVVVGTSGWQYRDWRGPLYPPDLPQRDWLAYYAGQYATVENNSTFYRLPARDTFADWQARTPGDFVMTVKASRYLTHVKRLRDPEEPVAKLMAAATGLGGRLGAVLLQLPPNLTADPGRLAACLAAFGPYRGTRLAVEPRHPSWWTEEVRQVLAEHGAALCWADQLGRPVTPLWRTAGWGYLRFHQGAAQPWPRYGQRALRSWLDRVAETWPDEATVYVYFNNDPGGAAVADSVTFAAACRRAGRTVTRTPVVPTCSPGSPG
jgi:uncharacterized protein YecE (DUF72 family)